MYFDKYRGICVCVCVCVRERKREREGERERRERERVCVCVCVCVYPRAHVQHKSDQQRTKNRVTSLNIAETGAERKRIGVYTHTAM